MKNLKVFLALLLALTMVLSMTACGGNNAGKETDPKGTTDAPAGNDDTAGADDTTAAPAKDLSWLNLGGVVPIVEEGTEKTLTICIPIGDETIDTVKDRFVYKFITEQMNINVDLMAVPSSAWGEKLPLILADYENLPDIIIQGGFKVADLLRYGGQEGTFLDLAPYINEQYMPNLASIFADYPALKANWTDNDGHIWSFGKISAFTGPDDQQWHYLNYQWMEDCGLDPMTDMPTTLDEFTDLMRKFKEVKSAEFGEEIYPIGGKFTGWNSVCRYLMVACGFVGYNRDDANPGTEINLRNGEVVLPCADAEGWTGFITTLKTWYDEGLIHPEFFTGEASAIDALSTEGKVGFTTVVPFVWQGNDGCINWWGAPDLTSEWCDEPAICDNSITLSVGNVVVTTGCDELELALAFIDFMYNRADSLSGLNAYLLGAGPYEGTEWAEIYPDYVMVKPNGNYSHTWLHPDYKGYTDNSNMLANLVILWSQYSWGNCGPEDENGMVNSGSPTRTQWCQEYLGKGVESAALRDLPEFMNDFGNHYQYIPCHAFFGDNIAEEQFPSIVYLDAETQENADDLLLAIREFAYTETAKFIVGDRPIEELPDYFDEINALGASEYVKIYADYYESYKAG